MLTFGSYSFDCSSKVICAFLESSDSKVRKLAKKELQPLIDGGIIKIPEAKQSANEDQTSPVVDE